MQGRDILVQWNGKQILTQNPDLVIETDAFLQGRGYPCPALMQGRGGGKWNAKERYHQCIGVISSIDCSFISCQEQIQNPCSLENGQHHSNVPCKQNGVGPDPQP